MEVPVYLFTGFLGAGKTTFIQDALSDEGFNDEERTLLLLCEEGEVEYRPSDFYNDDVYIERISEPSMLKSETLARFRAECEATRVVIEQAKGVDDAGGGFDLSDVQYESSAADLRADEGRGAGRLQPVRQG